MAEISSDPPSHSHSTPLLTSNPNPTIHVPAPPTSSRQPAMPTPSPNLNADSVSDANANLSDNTKSFMRWSIPSSLPSGPETGKSTWSLHPEEYDPDPAPLVDLSNADFGPSATTGLGVGGVAGDRSSFDTFGKGPSPRSNGLKDGEGLNEELDGGLPGRVLKFNKGKDMRSKTGPANHALKDYPHHFLLPLQLSTTLVLGYILDQRRF